MRRYPQNSMLVMTSSHNTLYQIFDFINYIPSHFAVLVLQCIWTRTDFESKLIRILSIVAGYFIRNLMPAGEWLFGVR